MTAAIVEAMSQEMERDPDVFLAGEDVRIGGVFGTDAGLHPKFGDRRVVNTPIAESGIVGLAVGSAAAGLRPIIEIMFMDFVGVCMDQLVNQMAKMKYMFGGKATLPIVVRTHAGAGRSMAAQHSQSLEAWFCHVPGVKVIMPSNAYDAKGLLIASIREDNPVIFIENKRALGQRAEVPDEAYTIPIGLADVKREGTDVTVVATGYLVIDALEAAEELAERGVSVEVVDPRTLSPLDMDTIVDSVKKTSRAVVAQEAVNFAGFGAEIAASIQERAFDFLDAPVKRVGAPFSPVPFAPSLENAWLPGKAEIIAAVEEIVPVRA
jgi:pyruvate dehydrogenase E1 component beta subunit